VYQPVRQIYCSTFAKLCVNKPAIQDTPITDVLSIMPFTIPTWRSCESVREE